jgi:hypothetical protein
VSLLKKNYSPDAADNGGGSAEVSAPMTATAQSEGAGSVPDQSGTPTSNETVSYDSAYFDEINRKMSTEKYEPSSEELNRFHEFQKSGKVEGKTTSPASKTEATAEVKTPDASPKGPIDVEKLVSEGKSNTWTDEESSAVESAMKRVGAKSPQELLQKVEGALKLQGQKGSENGELQKQMANLQAQVESNDALYRDLAAGVPEALEYIQKTFKLTLAQAKQVQSEAKDGAADDTVPDNVIDVETWKENRRLNLEMQKLRESVDSIKSQAEKNAEAAMEQARTMEQASKMREARLGFIEQMVHIAEEDPETYGIKSGSVRELMTKYYFEGKTDPRLTNHIALAQFARDNRLNTFTDAFKLKNYEKLSEKVIQAHKAGRDSALEVGRPQSLSALRGQAGTEMNPQYTVEDIRAMERGEKSPPKEWFNGSILVREKVPEQYRKAIFGR